MSISTIPKKWWRRACQVLCLVAFFWLFRMTESNGSAELTLAANILFRLDPVVAASAVLAGAKLIYLLWPALVLVGLTLIFGRFFCGWMCPLGTLLDMAHRLLPNRHHPAHPNRRVWKFYVLGLVLTSAVLGFQLIGYVNPFSILVRGMAVAVDPWLNLGVTAPFTWLYKHAPESVTNISEPVYAFIKAHVLPFQQNAFMFAWVSFAILAGIFALEFVEKRFWCRNLCPTGALLGWISRFSLMRRFPARVCGNCRAQQNCGQNCRMGAFSTERKFIPESCNLCMDCVDHCPIEIPEFSFTEPKVGRAPFEPSRRLFLSSVVTGMALPVVTKAVPFGHDLPADLVRPPGALAENDFLNLCVRCGECMKVCTTNALQPTLFESGLEGAFSPRLRSRIGYCEYNCTLCGQVCPTGAIQKLPVAEKQKVVMGMAIFDKKLCLPFAKAESCITCEEHCPLPEKAIKFKDVQVINAKKEKVMVKQPYVIWSLCIGCGICETKCPIDGPAGVRILRLDAVPASAKNDPEIVELPKA